MMTISVVNIDEIGSRNADWYVILLEDNWKDPFRDEFYENVDYFAEPEVIGYRNWVVRGHKSKRDEFFSAVFHRYRLYLEDFSFQHFPRPALLVTNTPPPPEETTSKEFDSIVRIVFPLAEHYVKAGSITAFLQRLGVTLQSPDALKTLQSQNEQGFVETWGWLLDCFEIKPSFLGIASFDVKEFIKQISQR